MLKARGGLISGASRATARFLSSDFFRESSASVLLRGLALVGKLLFLVCAGKNLAVAEMGVYGLMTATVGIAVTVLGLEFYAFSQREILAREGSDLALGIRDQFAFYGLAYLTLLPVALVMFASGVLPWRLAGWFLALAFLEHLAQETARVFQTLFRPVLSTALFFLRSAAWAIIIVWLWYAHPTFVTLQLIFGAWVGGVVISLLFAAFELRHLDWSRSGRTPVDWTWIRRGIMVAGPFLISALSYRIIELADRYIIHYLLNDGAVGVYSFYGTLANAMPAVVGASVSSFLTPRIIRAYQAGNATEYRSYYRQLVFATFGITTVTAPVVFLAVVSLQSFLSKPEYARELPTFAVLLLSTTVGLVAQLPAVALYARKDDGALLIAVLIGAVANTLLNLLLIPPLGIMGAAWATTIAYGFMGTYQFYRVRRAPTRFIDVRLPVML